MSSSSGVFSEELTLRAFRNAATRLYDTNQTDTGLMGIEGRARYLCLNGRLPDEGPRSRTSALPSHATAGALFDLACCSGFRKDFRQKAAEGTSATTSAESF